MVKKKRESSNPKIEQMMNFLQDLQENLEKDSWTKLSTTKLAIKHGLYAGGLKSALIKAKFVECHESQVPKSYRLGDKPVSADLAQEIIRLRSLEISEYYQAKRVKLKKPQGVFPDNKVIDFREFEIPKNPLTKSIIEDRNASARRLYEEIISSDAFKEILKLDRAIHDGIKH